MENKYSTYIDKDGKFHVTNGSNEVGKAFDVAYATEEEANAQMEKLNKAASETKPKERKLDYSLENMARNLPMAKAEQDRRRDAASKVERDKGNEEGAKRIEETDITKLSDDDLVAKRNASTGSERQRLQDEINKRDKDGKEHSWQKKAEEPEAEEPEVEETKVEEPEVEEPEVESQEDTNISPNEAKSSERAMAEQVTQEKIDAMPKNEEQDNKDKNLNAFWNAWKKGDFDRYPTMKALADSIAKNAQMHADRANILTGKGSDASVYTPIETEQDKIRAAQVETRAGEGIAEEALDAWKNGDTSKVAELVGSKNMTVQQAAEMIGISEGELNEKLKNAAGSTLDQNINAAKKAVLENKATVQSNLNAIRERITEIDATINQLKGNEDNLDAYIKGMNAYVGTKKGIKEISGIDTSNESAEKTFSDTLSENVNTGTVPNAFVKGGVNNSSTWNSGSSKSTATTNSNSEDVLAYAALPSAEVLSQQSYDERKKANEELISKLEATKADLESYVKVWEGLM